MQNESKLRGSSCGWSVLVHGPEQISVPFKGTNCEWYQIKVHVKEFQNLADSNHERVA